MKQIGEGLTAAVKSSREGNIDEASKKFEEIKMKIQSEFEESLKIPEEELDAADIEI